MKSLEGGSGTEGGSRLGAGQRRGQSWQNLETPQASSLRALLRMACEQPEAGGIQGASLEEVARGRGRELSPDTGNSPLKGARSGAQGTGVHTET